MKKILNSNEFLLKSAISLAVFVAGLLIVGKFFAYRISGSLSIEASLLDSCLDGFVSIVNFFAVRQALEPADDDHRFGHGKVEALAGLLQSFFIAGSSLWLLREVILNFFSPKAIIFHNTVFCVMIAASLITLLLVIWQKYVIAKTKSLAVEADCLHYQTDLFMNLGVLATFTFSDLLNLPFIDCIIACIFALYIFKSSFAIGKKSFDILMDKELNQETIDKIKSILSQISEVKNYHDLRTRSSGQRIFIQMHIELLENLSLKESHSIAENIESKIISILPSADVIIHQDLFNPEMDRQKI